MKKRLIKAKIISNKRIAPDHFVMELDATNLAKYSKPGQFVNVKARENASDPLLRIPLGVHAVTKRGIKLLYKIVGQATTILSERRTGEALDVLGPLGNGYDLAPLSTKNARALIIAGGHGTAPLLALTEAVRKKKREVEFFTGACSCDHIVCEKEFKALGARVHAATEDGSRGCRGYVTIALRQYLERNARGKMSHVLFACGPRPMLKAVAAIAREFGVPAQVSLDAYMACGIGACLGCAIETTDGYKMVCKDGPVFDAREIIWEKV